MRGSLAVWCDLVDEGVSAPPVGELHFNIWMDLNRHSDVLDIGVLLKSTASVNSLRIYIPARVERAHMEDLSRVLEHSTTVVAVFNEQLTLGSSDDAGFHVLNGPNPYCRVIRYDINDNTEMTLEHFDEGTDRVGSVITLTKSVIDKFSHIEPNYIRIRLELVGSMRLMFSDQSDPSDKPFLSTFYRTEITEFRINERRNLTDSFKAQFGSINYPRIEAIHYFLVRHMRAEVARLHADFYKMRRLEPGLWEKYLATLGKTRPEDMIIYHWRKRADVKDGGVTTFVNDYVALAVFRLARANVFFYVVAIILLGAAGSATQALLTAVHGKVWGSPLLTQALILAEIVGVVLLFVLVIRWIPRCCRHLRGFFEKSLTRIRQGRQAA